MSTKYKKSKDIPTEVIINRLEELSDAVTQGRDAVLREFNMKVPAELDRDPDLVLQETAERLRELIKLEAWKAWRDDAE